MTLYKDNPNLKMKVVTTCNNEKEYRCNCKYIKGKYYKIDQDVFEINDTWYRKESGLIDFDYEKKKWVLKNSTHLQKGIVDFEKGLPKFGSFSNNYFNNCVVIYQGSRTLAINSEILTKNGFFENIATGEYYYEKDVNPASIKKMKSIHNEMNFQHKGYNIEDNREEFKLKKSLHEDYNPTKSRNCITFSKLLGEVTYGLEIETSEGNVPNHIQNRLGIIACRDGSIGAAEFVTIPLQGAKGLHTINEIAKELKNRCNIDIKCSLHIHIGNIALDRNALVTLYTLGYKLQDDIFRMFPYYKTDPRGIKHKNYCQKLKKLNIHPCKDFSKEGFKDYIDNVYYNIYMFLSDGIPPDENHNRKRGEHPIKNKWDRHSRYYHMNLQNMVFTNRGTCEFRLHTGTLNAQKMINWLFICRAIIGYAEENAKAILGTSNQISMLEVLDYYRNKYPTNERAAFLSDYLQAYFKERCKIFERDLKKEDKLSSHEQDHDKEYKFVYQGISSLV